MAKLTDLVLLRNDPVVAGEFLQAAIRGDVDAQYGIGLIFAEGRGLEQDEVKAYYWLTRAIEQGDEDADLLRCNVAINMTDEQFARARLLLKQRDIIPESATRDPRRRHSSGQDRGDRH